MRPTWAEINLSALRHNFSQIQDFVGSGVDILSVVKADAYGHGAVPVSRALVESGTAILGVATLDEAMELREAGIRAPIQLLSGFYEDELEQILKLDLTPTVCSLAALNSLEKTAAKAHKPVKYHLKIDTGMNRLGVPASGLADFLGFVNDSKRLILEGVFSHLADADCEDRDYTNMQLALFSDMMGRVKKAGLAPRYFHIANSPAIQLYPDSHLNMVRPGIMLYGAERLGGLEIKPVMELKSTIVEIKDIPEGARVSYGGTFKAPRPSRIGIMPIGYADGYMRELSNRGWVSVAGERAPVVGAVCMDLTMVDLTQIPQAEIGQEVSLFGNGSIKVEEAAEWAHTISYELLSIIGKRVRRIYI